MSLSALRRSYEERNRLAAELILSDPARYGGHDGFACVWARMFLARLDATRIKPKSEQRQLGLEATR